MSCSEIQGNDLLFQAYCELKAAKSVPDRIITDPEKFLQDIEERNELRRIQERADDATAWRELFEKMGSLPQDLIEGIIEQ